MKPPCPNRPCGSLKCLFLSLLAVLWLSDGCAGPTVDPGPRPARLRIEVQASVSKEQIRESLTRFGPPAAAQVRFASFFGPYWNLDADLMQEDGSSARLEFEPGQEFPRALGNRVQAAAVYLLPPGPRRLHLILCARIRQQWQESFGPSFPRQVKGRLQYDSMEQWRTRSQDGEVACFRREVTIDLRPGESFVLRPFSGE